MTTTEPKEPTANNTAAIASEAGHDDLAAVRRDAFAHLSRGAADRRSPLHTPGLASIGRDGFPATRTVVLRAFDAATRTLSVHTDRRSPKVAEIAENPRVAVLFYDPKKKIQLRLAGMAQIHTDDAIADAQWQRTTMFGRRCYLSTPPGTQASRPTSGLPAALQDRAPGREESAPGFANFAVIRIQFHRLDWLFLSVHGHRRALFSWDEESTENATWITP